MTSGGIITIGEKKNLMASLAFRSFNIVSSKRATMKCGKNCLFAFLAAGVLAFLLGCVAPQEAVAPSGTAPVIQAGQKQKTPQAPTVSEEVNVYKLKVEALTTLDCARCHYSVFSDIRDGGGKHQLQCRKCHQTFHIVKKPGRSLADVVPKCTSCHGEIHGGDFAVCLSCHQNAHAPIESMVNIDTLSRDCNRCHVNQGTEIKKYESAHADIECSECHHTRHGFRPNCTECHPGPHTPYKDNTGCGSCHPVHSPLEISYGKDIPNTICAQCHEEVGSKLSGSNRKHSSLQCISCHAERHRTVPQCQSCHKARHSEAMLQRFSKCQDCHGDAHALYLTEK
jgi:hypothetical protein